MKNCIDITKVYNPTMKTWVYFNIWAFKTFFMIENYDST